jgi:hypothetical protein
VELRIDEARFVTPLWPAAFPAAILGTLCGIALASVFTGPPNLAEDWLFLVYFGIGAFIFALLGLLIVGLPLTHLVRRVAPSRWSILLGALAGGLIGRLITGLMGLDAEFSARAIVESIGFLIGASTGVFWALLIRKRLVETLKEEALCCD